MTELRKAAEMALEALEQGYSSKLWPIQSINAIQALRQALAQSEHEPVCFLRETSWSYEIAPWDDPNSIPVYTAPPKREWVGLSDDEREHFRKLGFVGVLAVENKLKEKNGG